MDQFGEYQKFVVDVTGMDFSSAVSALNKKYEELGDEAIERKGNELVYALELNGKFYILGKNDKGTRHEVIFAGKGYVPHNKFPTSRLLHLLYPNEIKKYLIAIPSSFSSALSFETALHRLTGFNSKGGGSNIEKFTDLLNQRVQQLRSKNAPVVDEIIDKNIINYLGQIIGKQGNDEYKDILKTIFNDYRGEDKKLLKAVNLIFGIDVESGKNVTSSNLKKLGNYDADASIGKQYSLSLKEIYNQIKREIENS